MEYKKAKRIGEKLEKKVKDMVNKFEVCGSFRRGKRNPRDLDIVCIPKNPITFVSVLKQKLDDVKVTKYGKKYVQIDYMGEQVDIYMATEKTFETIKMIRTGSAGHNIKLCSKAKEKGWHLYASGKGLYNGKEMIANTEKEIIEKLLGKYVPPHRRS